MDGMSVEAIVNKSGENRIQVTVGRSADGLRINVWARPEVEEFVRGLGTGEQHDVQVMGRYWVPVGVDKAAKKLLAYDASNHPIYTVAVNEKLSFRLDKPGQPLFEPAPRVDLRLYGEDEERPRPAARPMGECLNLSFLRLVGISEGGGVSFAIRGVYERASIDHLGAQVEAACNRFYREYLKPYRLIVTVSTMPISGI